jgi:hypothetical protein
MDVLYLCAVLPHGAQSTIKACPERVEAKRGCHSVPVSRREQLIRLVAPSLTASITRDIRGTGTLARALGMVDRKWHARSPGGTPRR